VAKAERLIQGLADGSWQEHVAYMKDQYGSKMSGVIGEKLGLSVEAGRRWANAAGIGGGARKSTPTPSHQAQLAQLVAADKLTKSAFHPGNGVYVSSSSGSPDGGPRRVQALTGVLWGENMADVAAAIEGGRWDAAGEALDAQVMDAYGGVGGALFDCDYGDDAGFA
jgi:hypothetical protein